MNTNTANTLRMKPRSEVMLLKYLNSSSWIRATHTARKHARTFGAQIKKVHSKAQA